MVMSLYDQMRTSTSFDSWLTNDGATFYDQSFIEKRTKELLERGETFDYRTYENFAEAINCVNLEQAETIEEFMSDPLCDLEKFGRFIRCLVIESMEKWATSQATREDELR
jgi:hypothetical protein